MRILHVITSLETGGAEHLMVDLLPRLRELGNNVEIAVFNCKRTYYYEQLERAGIKIHGFSETDGYYSIKHFFRLRKIMKSFDIVHTHNTACQFYAAFGKNDSIRLVTTEHSTSTRRRQYPILKYLDRWMYGKYDKIICISEPSETNLRNYIGNNYPIITIHNGVNIECFANSKVIDLGLKGHVIITMVAGFRYEKDQPTLIKSLKYLPEKYHVLLIGDGERRKEIETLINVEGLKERVHLFGVRKDVPSILKSSDVIVMSSHREGMSLSNIEGMASGKPFVASNVEGLREVTDGYGVLFPHGDSKSLAVIIKRLTEDNAYRQEVVSRCKARAAQFDIAIMAQEYQKEYNGLFSTRS